MLPFQNCFGYPKSTIFHVGFGIGFSVSQKRLLEFHYDCFKYIDQWWERPGISRSLISLSNVLWFSDTHLQYIYVYVFHVFVFLNVLLYSFQKNCFLIYSVGEENLSFTLYTCDWGLWSKWRKGRLMGEKEYTFINIFMFTGAYRLEVKLKEAVILGGLMFHFSKGW